MAARICLLLLLIVAGCGMEARFDSAVSSRSPQVEDRSAAAASGGDVAVVSDTSESMSASAGTLAGVPAADEARKIIYNGRIDLVVKDFAEARTAVEQLVQQAKGFVAEFREDRTRGDQLAGRWVVRVPASGFASFLDDLARLGVPESRQTDAEDVTEEYVDLETRIANKKRLEERILKLIEEREGKIDEVIKVESELARVREEIERMEGRLRFLADRTTLSTVTISAREERDYTPPQAPDFGTQIAGTFSGSLQSLQDTGQAVVLAAVAAGPWVLMIGLVLAPVAWRWRRRRDKRTAVAAAVRRS